MNFDIFIDDHGRRRYILRAAFTYYSKRYNKLIAIPEGTISDGASGPAIDIASNAWWIHDLLCVTHRFDDGTRCTAWQASVILGDILKEEGRWIRAPFWTFFTYLATRRGFRSTGPESK